MPGSEGLLVLMLSGASKSAMCDGHPALYFARFRSILDDGPFGGAYTAHEIRDGTGIGVFAPQFDRAVRSIESSRNSFESDPDQSWHGNGLPPHQSRTHSCDISSHQHGGEVAWALRADQGRHTSRK